MAELVQQNWVLLLVALLIGLAVAWWIFVAARRTRVEVERREDETGPARRNQALIDAPPAAAAPPANEIPPPAPAGLAGVGEAVSAAAQPVPVAAEETAPGDDLTRIKGLGPKLAEQLRGLGVTRLDQIAAWDEAEIDRIDAQLGRFQGRIRRDSWLEQARLLAAGDTAGYEAKFGRL